MVVQKTFVKKGSSKGGACKWCAVGQCWTHGGKAGKGGGRKGGGKNSGGGGQWLFVPNSGKGKGKGKGKDPKKEQFRKSMDKLDKFEASQKVWVGGLSKDTTWKQLEKHCEETGGTKPKLTEVMKKGTGVLAFKSEDDASAAIAALNGSDLDGNSIEADVWTQKEKKEGEERPKRKFGAAFVKGKKVGVDGLKTLKGVDAELKVWVGGLSPKTTAAKLKKYFVENGSDADECILMKNGTACVTFKTEAEASSAIALDGSCRPKLDGKAMEVDVWTKIEKKDKKVKKEE